MSLLQKRYKGEQPEGKNKFFLSMIALDSPTMPTIPELENGLKNYSVTSGLRDFKRENNIISFSDRDSAFGAIALMPAPIPWCDLEGPCATSWLWREATQEMKRHSHHLIITIDGNRSDVIGGNLKLTGITAALCRQPECVGVYWGAGRLVLSKEVFLKFAKGMSREFLPLYLWIDFRRQREKDGAVTVYTTGMDSMELREIEIRNSKLELSILVDRAFNVCHYMLDHGPILKDGDTIGLSAEEKILIRHAPSMWDRNQLVYQLIL